MKVRPRAVLINHSPLSARSNDFKSEWSVETQAALTRADIDQSTRSDDEVLRWCAGVYTRASTSTHDNKHTATATTWQRQVAHPPAHYIPVPRSTSLLAPKGTSVQTE
jgi:hypothetical protein